MPLVKLQVKDAIFAASAIELSNVATNIISERAVTITSSVPDTNAVEDKRGKGHILSMKKRAVFNHLNQKRTGEVPQNACECKRRNHSYNEYAEHFPISQE